MRILTYPVEDVLTCQPRSIQQATGLELSFPPPSSVFIVRAKNPEPFSLPSGRADTVLSELKNPNLFPRRPWSRRHLHRQQ
jgi:hypothetical protein